MTNNSTKDDYCPFWDKFGERTCRLVESGLFIPTRDHILHFCENESFIKCYHYVRGKNSPGPDALNGNGDERLLKNRRLYTRIPTMQKLTVSRYSLAKEANEDILDEQALVLDLSLGGMRIETSAPININQIISFAFDDQFHPPGFVGKGEIRWIRHDQIEDAPSNAGLAFVDAETANTVKSHLLGMGEKLLRLSGF